MTKLLVSVRNAAEARIACDHGADLIDVKEPLRGALGAADMDTIAQIAHEVAGQIPLSAALGELLEGNRVPGSFAHKLQFAKFGLAGCAALHDWPLRWRQAVEQLPTGAAPVAVAYADWQTARAPEPTEVLRVAQSLGCAAVLLDTFDKSRGPLTSLWTLAELEDFVNEVRDANLLGVVAGSLGEAEIARVLPLEPDYIGVRGAVCVGDRLGCVSAKRVSRLAKQVHTFAPARSFG